MRATRALAAGGVAGPAAFIASWAVLGATAPGYSPVDDAISRLAMAGAPTRPWMTAGLVAVGLGAVAHAVPMRRWANGPSALLLAGGGLATLGVAAFPLGPAERAHAVSAAFSYACLSGAAVAAVPALRRDGRRGWARASLAAGSAGAALLAASFLGPSTGLLQRAGLTVLDAWIMATAASALAGGGPRHPRL